MRYILNDDGYIDEISFDNVLECKNKICIEYTGSIPTGYTSLEEWSENAIIQAYKVESGNLVYYQAKETELQSLWNNQKQSNNPILQKNIKNSRTTSDTDTYSCNYINGYVLYNNNEGTNENITLSDSVANYQYIEIFFRDDASLYKSYKFYNCDGNQVSLDINVINPSHKNQYIQTSIRKINAKTINVVCSREIKINCSNKTIESTNEGNYIYITRVVGYK